MLDDAYFYMSAIKIYTQDDLEKIAEKPDENYQLESDIVLDNTYTRIEEFNGTFDGNKHTISGIIYGSNTDGIFETIGENGKVKNLKLQGNDWESNSDYGSLARYNYGIIENCNVEINVDKNNGENIERWDYSYIYGFSYYNYGIIKNCISKGKLNGTSECCGITDWNYNIVERCYNFCNITSSSSGGIVYANNKNGIIRNCVNFGTISSGGIVGDENYGIIENCYDISETKILVNDNDANGKIINCYSYNDISNKNGIIENCDKLTSENITKKETYKGFDFENIWQIEEGKTSPYLREMEKPEWVNINE